MQLLKSTITEIEDEKVPPAVKDCILKHLNSKQKFKDTSREVI
jgi:hypothetical protein